MRTEDGQMVYECLNGNPGVFGVLVDKYKEGIYALAYSRLGNFHDAQDVAQEAFIKAYKKLHTLRHYDRFSAWLCAITNNLCKNMIQSKKSRPDREYVSDQQPELIDNLSMDSHRAELVDESLREALDSLPDIYRQVLVLHYFSGMKGMDMARLLGVSIRTVTERLRIGREKLKEEMIIMMSATFKEQKLPAGFTFRIVEAVKKIRINPFSQSKVLPWGISLATGIIIAVLNFSISINPIDVSGKPAGFPLPVTSKVLKTGEIPVDIMKIDKITVISSNQGDGNSGEVTPPKPQGKLSPAFMSPAKEGQWTRKADMPTARTSLSTSEVDGIIYAIGGSRNGTMLQTVEAYDPKTDTWTRKADMPTQRYGLSVSVVDGIIYAIGGFNNPYVSTVEAYDPATDSWTKKADMPTAREWFSTSVIDGIIYAIGGWKGIKENDKFGVLSTVEAYDPVTDTWMKKADMLTPRFGFTASEVNGTIYAFGGQDSVDY